MPSAAAELDEFLDRALPTLLRRFRFWNGLCPDQHRDVLDDLGQELALDCLEHHDQIRRLPVDERHRRWFRLLEQRHYRLRLRDRRRTHTDLSLDDLVDSGSNPLAPEVDLLPVEERPLAQRLLQRAEWLKNGRLNACHTARNLGIRGDEIRAFWERSASSLGFDGEYLGFWLRRLVEALLSYAADLLTDSGAFAGRPTPTAGAAPGRPDPRAQIRRIRRIRTELGVRPVPPLMRSILARFGARGAPRRSVQEALDAASQLMPQEPTVSLWKVEAARARRDRAGTARALRAAHRQGADRVALVLARTRWHHDQGNHRGASALLIRSSTRFRGDPRLSAALGAKGVSTPSRLPKWRPAPSVEHRTQTHRTTQPAAPHPRRAVSHG